MASKLNMSVAKTISQYDRVTHFIATSLLRTNKFMAAALRTSCFVTFEWLDQCYKSGQIISCDEYHMVDDPLFTEKYGITHSSMLVNGKLARESGGVLANMVVYVGAGVAGKKNDAPELADIKQLVKLAGGNVAATQAQALVFGPSKLLIITKRRSNANKVGSRQRCQADHYGVLIESFLPPESRSNQECL